MMVDNDMEKKIVPPISYFTLNSMLIGYLNMQKNLINILKKYRMALK